MLKADREMGKALARIIAKEEIAAAGTKSESKIKDLEAKIDKLEDILVKDSKDFEPKNPAATKSVFAKKGGK